METFSMAKQKGKPSVPITDRLRRARVEVLGKSVRDVAKILGTSPIHLSDIETGKRSPSEDLLVRIAGVYGIPIAELRSGFSRPEAIVLEVASESTTAAEKVPEFLRVARGWSVEQWEAVIKQAKKLNDEKEP
jgi:transcriptional regulator with XRE-family HTH domain